MSSTEVPVLVDSPPTAASASAQQVLADPLTYGETFNTYLEQFVLTRLPTTPAFQVLAQKMAYPVGFPRLIMEDLTANTSEYVWTDPVTGLGYLYCNGAAVSQTTYADLYAQWGASKWAADSGGNFSLPDTRGRGLVLCGTNAAVDLGDTFGPATESARTGNTHGHARTSLTVTIGNESSHTHGAGSYTNPHKGADATVASTGAGAGMAVLNSGTVPVAETITGTSGAGSAHSHTATVGGTIGTDTNEGGSGIVIGSLVVRF